MPSKEERKAILRRLAEKERLVSDFARPVGLLELGELFDLLDGVVCDHTFKWTRHFLKDKNLDEVVVIDWLTRQGGNCDCEVLANVEERWQQSIEQARQSRGLRRNSSGTES